MPRFQAPRGTRDLLPPERGVFLHLESAARALAARYGYQPIETPLFEQAAVFERGVGEVTDVVEKELFRVQAGRGDDERERWALRPEPTAGIVRAYVQHGMRTWPPTGPPDDHRSDVPLRPSPGGPLPAVLAVRRRGHRRSRAGHRRRGHRAGHWPSSADGRPVRRRGAPELHRRRRLPAGLHRRPARALPAPRGRAPGARARTPRAQPAAAARLQGRAHGAAHRQRADHRAHLC